MSPFVERALAGELPAKDLSTPDLVRRLRGITPDHDITCPADCMCQGTWKFVRRTTCTDWCGKSSFEDWQHTPLCEKRYEERY